MVLFIALNRFVCNLLLNVLKSAAQYTIQFELNCMKWVECELERGPAVVKCMFSVAGVNGVASEDKGTRPRHLTQWI